MADLGWPGFHTLTCRRSFQLSGWTVSYKNAYPDGVSNNKGAVRDRFVPCFEVCNTPHLSIPSGFVVALVENVYFPMVFISKSRWQEYPPEARSSEIVGL